MQDQNEFTTVFVSNLPRECSKEEIRQYFLRVLGVEVFAKKGKNKGKRIKKYAMMQVPNGLPLERVLAGEHNIRGNLITIKIFVESKKYIQEIIDKAKINKANKASKKAEK